MCDNQQQKIQLEADIRILKREKGRLAYDIEQLSKSKSAIVRDLEKLKPEITGTDTSKGYRE